MGGIRVGADLDVMIHFQPEDRTMQTNTIALFFALSLAVTALACAQEEKQVQGQKQDQSEMLAQGDQHDEGDRHDEGKKHDEDAKGHSHGSSELHAGAVIMTSEHHFEVVFAPEEIRVYGYDGEQKPINEMEDVKITLTLKKRGEDAEEMALDYLGPDPEAGRSQGYFTTSYEFAEVEEGQMKATFTVSGMGKEPIKFKTAVSVSELVTYACPMHPEITGEDPIECSECGMTLTMQAHEEGDHEKNENSHEGHDH